ncbi:MAG TPA: type II toxin-antitoxin system death-on-curing family toxin [Candidatus Paceibacterota bacterium]
MKYLDPKDILIIHARIIDATTGTHGIRDIGLLKSAALKSQSSFAGKDLYKGLFLKAAILFEAIVNYHVFVDGNKRTGIASAARFLYLNGYSLKVSNREMVDFVLKIATKKVSIEETASWLERNSVGM